jgi:hypothetical protein
MPDTWKDSVGTNHLTDNNTVGLIYKGPTGKVAQFTAGDADYLEAASPIIDISQSVSVAGWMYRPTAADGGVVNIDNATNRPFNIDVSGGSLRCYPNGGYIASITAPPAGRWAFFCGSVNRQELALGRVHMFLNGVDGTTRDMDGAINATTSTVFRVGTRKAWNDNNSPFQMAYIGVWQKALSVAEQQSLMNGGVGKAYADLTAAEKVGLLAYWDMDETSGDRADSHASYTLTDKNTVQSATATNGSKSAAAASFVAANSERLSGTAVDISATTGMTVSFWVKWPSGGSYGQGVFTHDDVGANRCWTFDMPSATEIDFYVFDSDSGHSKSDKSALSADTWYHVVGWYDPADKKSKITVNGVAGNDGTALSNGPKQGPSQGINVGGYNASPYFGGNVDEIAIWNRVLTADERTALYAAGAGKFYPFEE